MKKAIIFLIAGTLLGVSAFGAAKIKHVSLKIENEPIVSFRFVFHAGPMNDPEGKNGLAHLTAQILANASTKQNKYEDILKKLFPLASGYFVQVDREYITFIGESHKDNLDSFYSLFRDALLNPAFLEEDFNRLKTATINGIKTNLRYSNDEELGKAVFKAFVYRGTPYEKNIAGRVADLEKITLADVKKFYRENFTQANLIAGLSGNFPDALISRIDDDFAKLPQGPCNCRQEAVKPPKIEGIQVTIVEKATESTGIHIGFPIDLMRNHEDFHALFLANSWLGEHRNSSSHLYQVIREDRGMNYGDYSYIEDFPRGGGLQFPPTNVYKKPQLFEIWIRPVENNNRLFALRAALREVKALVEKGMTKKDFELTQKFLSKYYLHFAATASERLGYKIDDTLYGLKEPYLENFKEKIAALTLDKVNQVIKNYLRADNLKIVFVTNEADKLKNELINNTPSPITYRTPKPAEVLEEDKIIQVFPLAVKPGNIAILPLDEVFK
jgi:zinc protease